MAKKSTNYYRIVLQWIIVVLLGYMVIRLFVDPNYIADFEAYCPLGGSLALSSFLVNNSLACSMTETQIFMGIVLFAGVIIFSKLFCSYICPIGTFTEWLGRIGQKFKIRYTIKGIADRLLRSLKYALLFITFYYTTQASELFCREYDPFYAVFSGFGDDVVLWFAIPAVVITVLGSVFIRQFWCKYMCPLGAASNIFSNVVLFAAVFSVYAILLISGLDISWIWPLALVSIGGFALESTRLKSWLVPVLKITRNESTCTSCKLCDENCPMDIPISEMKTVDHIDCHLCQDCVYSCPENNVLQINHKEWRPVPAFAVVGLVAIGFFLATTIELPTINIKWGQEEAMAKAAIYEQEGLKNIKCFGSSRSFATKMRNVSGILGVETFVKSHGIKLFYDPETITPEQIKESIFTPLKTFIRIPGSETKTIASVGVQIDKLFDDYDSFYLRKLLTQNENIFAIETSFGEPVAAHIYFDPAGTDISQIVALIESDQLVYASAGKEITLNLNFSVASADDSTTEMSRIDMFRQLFTPYQITFNKYKEYKPEDMAVYRIEMPQAMTASSRSLSFLVSHISHDDYIVKFETVFEDKTYADIHFIKDQTTPESIYDALKKEKLHIIYSNGKEVDMPNSFKFPREGVVLE